MFRPRKKMTYQKKPLGDFHLEEFLGISFLKCYGFGLDLNDKISQMNFLYHKLHNSDYHDGFIVKIYPQKVNTSMPIFPSRKLSCGSWRECTQTEIFYAICSHGILSAEI